MLFSYAVTIGQLLCKVFARSEAAFWHKFCIDCLLFGTLFLSWSHASWYAIVYSMQVLARFFYPRTLWRTSVLTQNWKYRSTCRINDNFSMTPNLWSFAMTCAQINASVLEAFRWFFSITQILCISAVAYAFFLSGALCRTLLSRTPKLCGYAMVYA